jgi:apolipoprotein N-acyltransferase
MTNSSDMETEAVAAGPAQVEQMTLLGIARARWPVFALYGLATFFSFPHEMPGSENGAVELGYWVAWFGPAALVVGVAGLAPRRAAWVAFLASLVAHSVFFHWFMVVTIEYGGMPFLLGAMAPIVPALYVSIFTALFVWGYASWRSVQGRPDGLRGVIVGAAWWVAVDLARGHFLGGFPWATLGYALHLDEPMLAWTRWFGVYVLSFVIVAVGIALAGAWQLREHGAYRRLAGVVGAVILLHAVGFFLNGAFEAQNAESAETVRVAAVQGNIDQGEKWDVDRRTRILETYLRLSDSAGAEGVEWIVWPETAVPGLIENDPTLRSKLSDLALRHDAFLIVGGMGVEIDHAARRFSAFFDSAFQFDPLGQMQDRYDKTHLVPFGEFVPLRGLLGHVFQSLATGLSSNDVTPGPRPRNMILATPGDPGPGRVVGVPICYELLFPHLVSDFGGQGAGALLAITNDAWYGRTGAPHQFLAMTAMRAAENGRPTVRAANTGISAIIDARGRVQQHSALFEEAIVVGEIQFVRDAPPTFYAQFGDVFGWACVGCSLLVIGRSVMQEKRRARAPQNDKSAG